MRDLWRLLCLFRSYRGSMICGIALATGVILANVALLALAGWFITAMAVAGLGLGTISYFTPAAGIRGLAIVRSVGRYGERLVTHDATLRLLSELRIWFYQTLEPLAPARLQFYRGGDLLSRIRADIDALDNFYLNVWIPSTAALCSVMLMAGFLAWFSIRITLTDLSGLILVGMVIPWGTQRLGSRPGYHAVALRTALRSSVADTVRGLGELHVYEGAAQQKAKIDQLNHALITPQRQQAFIDAVSSAGASLAAQLSMWVAVVIAITLVSRHRLTGADISLLALFLIGSFEAVNGLPLAFRNLGETRAAARRIFEIADMDPTVRDPLDDSLSPPAFGIQIRNLCMRYGETAAWALDDINLTVAPGQRLAIVGPTGAGKTSIINVLLRFWDYQAGSIEIGGKPLIDFKAETIRTWFSVVSQHTHLFNTSVRQNLLLAVPEATEVMLTEVLRQVDMYHDVMTLPKGLDTQVGEAGVQLSGGQARRIAVARALLRNAPILILDEPTEGLDAISERTVLEALDVVMRERTTLMITHRSQVLHYADQVAIMNRGRVIEYGNMRQLIQQNQHLSSYMCFD